MPNIHCNIWSGDEGREDCPKGASHLIDFFSSLYYSRNLPNQVTSVAAASASPGLGAAAAGGASLEDARTWRVFFTPSQFL